MSIKGKVEILDGICGMGKTHLCIDLIKKITLEKPVFTKNDDKVIYATPYRKEAYKMADINSRYSKQFNTDFAIKDKHGKVQYNMIRKFSFLFESTMDGNNDSLKNLKDLIKNNKNIVTTHSALFLMDKEAIELANEHNYHLIIDEAPQLIKTVEIEPPISKSEYESLVTLELIRTNADKSIEWLADKKNIQLSRYDNLRTELITNCCYLASFYNSEAQLVWRQNPELFLNFKSVTVLTYLYQGTLLNSYFDWCGIKCTVLDLTKIGYLINDRIKNYDELINLYEPRALNHSMFTEENALSVTWYRKVAENAGMKVNLDGQYKKSSKDSDLDILSKKTKSFFTTKVKPTQALIQHSEQMAREYMGINKNDLEVIAPNLIEEPASSNERLWSTFKAYREVLTPTTGANFNSSNFLSWNQKATNDYAFVKQMAYLVNIYPNPSLLSFLNTVNAPIDSEKYAISEMIQWIFRSRVRNGEFISLFIASARMKRLYKQWAAQFETMRYQVADQYLSEEQLEELSRITKVEES